MTSSVVDHPYREFERAGWERAASAYAGSFEAATGLFAEALLDAAQVRAGMSVLDIACGPGSVTAKAAARGAHVTGADFSPAMIATARQRHPALTFRECDAEALPFADASFDAVLCSFGVHHFPFPARGVAEARRVLRAGGRFAFATWAAPRLHDVNRIVVEAVRVAGSPGADLPTSPSGHVNEIEHCVKLLGDAGFLPGSLQAEVVKAHLMVASAAELLAIFEAGTVRLSTLIRSQPLENRAAIVDSVQAALAGFRSPQGFRIPFVAIVASGVR